jgi:multiple sugar transport system permease protein
MSAAATDTAPAAATMSPRQYRLIKALDIGGLIATIVTVIGAICWAFPLYWGVITTLKPEEDVVKPGFQPWPEHFTLDSYTHVIFGTRIGQWYVNSLTTSIAITVIVVIISALAGYAISQLKFPGRRILWWIILASFMIPVPALIVNHFVIIAGVKLINTHLGMILPMLITPVTVIVYKQFFDSVPREFREAAVMDGANEFQLLSRIFLPMNWGITTALAIITFIGAWNSFLWPFLVAQNERMMTVTVGITSVQDAFGVYYAKLLAGAVLAGLPVATAYLLFQRRVTQAITLSAGIKG